MRPPPRTWWAPAAHAIAVGLVGLGALGQPQLLEGGLAVLGATWIVAVFLGVALARSSWLDTERSAFEEALLLFVTVVSAGSLAGQLPLAWSLGVWCAAALLGRFGGVVPWIGLIAVGTLATIGSTTAWANGMPWEVLAPNPATWRHWLATALGAGALLGWAPVAWSRSEPPHPGRSALPWSAVGLVLLGALGWTLSHAASWLDQSVPVVLAALPLFAATTWLGVGGLRHLGTVLAVGLAATLFFQLAEQRVLWWELSLPLLLGVASLARAMRTRSLAAAAAGLLLIGGCALCYPGLPESLLAAAAVAVPWVGAVWFVGVRQQVAQVAP